MAGIEQFAAIVNLMRADGAHDDHREITASCDVCAVLRMMRAKCDDERTQRFVDMHLREPTNDFFDYGTWEVAPRTDMKDFNFKIEKDHEEMLIRGEPYIRDPRIDDDAPGYLWVLELSLGISQLVPVMCIVIIQILDRTTPGSYAHYNLRRELLRHESNAEYNYKIIR